MEPLWSAQEFSSQGCWAVSLQSARDGLADCESRTMSNYVPGGKKRCRSVFPVQREKKNMWCLASKKRTGWPFQSVWKKKPDVFLKSQCDWRLALCSHIKGELTRSQQLMIWSQAVLLSGTQMFYKDPDHHAVLCAETMEFGGEGGGRGRHTGFSFPLLLSSLLKTFSFQSLHSCSHSTASNYSPWPSLLSKQGCGPLKVSPSLYLTIPCYRQALQEEMRSQLPGDLHQGLEWLWFILYRAKSKLGNRMPGGRQGRSPPAHQGQLFYCPWGGPGQRLVVWRGKGKQEKDEREEAACKTLPFFCSLALGSLLKLSHILSPPLSVVIRGRHLTYLSLGFPLSQCYLCTKWVPSEQLLARIKPFRLLAGFLLVNKEELLLIATSLANVKWPLPQGLDHLLNLGGIFLIWGNFL